mmetsp:Transcript_11218/g.17628  ORF Transcript_11218/g.17628 Transcript_11218/m.17628 type:complete len:109 (+) Transcript_11218:272-598(+)
MGAFVELARWWRLKLRQEPSLGERCLGAEGLKLKGRTQLVLLSSSHIGKQFLAERAKQIDPTGGSEDAALLGSIYHLLGQTREAEKYLLKAVEEDLRLKKRYDYSLVH